MTRSALGAVADRGSLEAPQSVDRTACCIVGAGPAGAVLSLLLARQGVEVTLLEAQHDFDRDFRGDTLMPSTLELIEQIGLTDQLNRLPHGIVDQLRIETVAGSSPYLEVGRLRTAFPYIMLVSQARFLELITSEAQRHRNFRLAFGARVTELLERDGGVVGVRYHTPDGPREIRASVTIGADGRYSKIRQLGGFEVDRDDEPRDLVWFRVPRQAETQRGRPGLYSHPGVGYVVVLPRGPEWQIGYTLPKGRYGQLRAAGLPALRQAVVHLVPWLAQDILALQDWNQVSLLTVDSNRVRRWYRPGLLLIGDAAHVMSPVGGVGINCAIQDAIVTANVLGPRLKRGGLSVQDLARVQRERGWPVHVAQTCQRMMQRRILDGPKGLPGLIFRFAVGRRLVSHVIGLGWNQVRPAGIEGMSR